MANVVKVKRSAVAGKTPTTADIQLGEIAVNTYDGKMFIKQDNGTESIVEIGAGSGDVTGPTSSTDNGVARFDGATGKIIKNSAVTLDDTGNAANINSVQFNLTPTVPTETGAIYWDEGNKSPSVNIDADVTLQLGQEMLALVYNASGSTITNGSVVAVSGAQGQRPKVVLADANSEALSAPTLGIATEDIADGAEGFITTFGFVRGINTSTFIAGAPIYLSETAGEFTATRPSAPAHTVALGWVIKVNASSGEVFVNINNGWELDELHNVLITNPVNDDILIYDGTTNVWKNEPLPASMVYPSAGIAVSTGTAWDTSKASPTGDLVGTTDTQTLSGKTLINPTITNYTETFYNFPSPASNFVIDLANGTVQSFYVNGNATITLPLPVAGKSFVLKVNYQGAYTLSWGVPTGGIFWPNGSPPTPTGVVNKSDLFTFFSDGTSTFGQVFGQNY